MKRILILAYDFPPYVSVGALRPYSWYKGLNEFGVYPIVISRQWNNKHGNHLDYISASKEEHIIYDKSSFGEIIRTSYKPNRANKLMLKYGTSKFKVIRKFISAFYEFTQFYIFIGSKIELYKAAKRYLNNNKVDCIIATGEPFILFRYASLLSRKFRIPWIADYRDPWSQNKARSFNKILKLWNEYQEIKALSNVYKITTVSFSFQNQIKKLLRNHDFNIIKNGFDEEIEHKAISQNNKKLNIAFVGTIYKWHPLQLFFNVCNQLITNIEDCQLQINFYGINNVNEVKGVLQKKYPLLVRYVNFIHKLSNQELMIKLGENSLLLLFNYYDYMGTKIYDYLAIRRKILFCFTHDYEALKLKKKYYNISNEIKGTNLQQEIIKKTKSGILIKNSKELLETLLTLYSEHQKNGLISCDSINIEEYSRKKQTKKLAQIVRNIEAEVHKNCLICSSSNLKKLRGYEKDYLVKCKSCKFIFSKRIPNNTELTNHYKKKYSRNDYLSLVTIKRYNELLDEMEKYRKNNNILDLGCGIGYFLEQAKKRGWNVFGTEFSDESITICNKKGINMSQGILTSSAFDRNFFDVITSFEVIEHINTPEVELNNVNKILRKGGLFYCTTPNFNSLSRRNLKLKWPQINYPDHLSYYTSSTISSLLLNNSLIPIKKSFTGFSFSLYKKGKTQREGSSTSICSSSFDEKLRVQMEEKILFKILKKILNGILTFFRLGDTIKIYAIKK